MDAHYIAGQPETDFLRIARPEDIRICDPAVGSGHMLTYAFDLLFVIYEEEGYAPERDPPALILRHNLQGIEICSRAAQLAQLALYSRHVRNQVDSSNPTHLFGPASLLYATYNSLKQNCAITLPPFSWVIYSMKLMA